MTEIEVVDQTKYNLIGFWVESKMADIGKVTGEHMGKLSEWIKEKNHKWEDCGCPISFYHKVDMAKDYFKFLCGFFVEKDLEMGEGMVKIETSAGKYAKLVHKGPYEKLHESWKALQVWGEKSETWSLVKESDSWEKYMNCPTQTKPEDLLTEIYWKVTKKRERVDCDGDCSCADCLEKPSKKQKID